MAFGFIMTLITVQKPLIISPSDELIVCDHGRRRRRSSERAIGSVMSLKGMGRRGLLSSVLLVMSTSTSTTTATTTSLALEAESKKKALLQKYLKKSEENKTKNDKQRLEDYYKRNYKDYFEFIEGSLKDKKEELSESEKGILEWLQTNK